MDEGCVWRDDARLIVMPEHFHWSGSAPDAAVAALQRERFAKMLRRLSQEFRFAPRIWGELPPAEQVLVRQKQLRTLRYIYLNPCRRGLAIDPLELKWSTYRELLGAAVDPWVPREPGSRPFDGEGLLSRRNVVVERGVLKTYLCDSYRGRKLGRPTTASASRGGGGGVGPSTTNFVLRPGELSPEEILEGTDGGLYVTEMMGFGFNPVTGDFSRGASGFWIEGGKLAYPVSEVTISLNIDELWKRVDAIGNDLDHRTATVAPTFRVSSMIIGGS